MEEGITYFWIFFSSSLSAPLVVEVSQIPLFLLNGFADGSLAVDLSWTTIREPEPENEPDFTRVHGFGDAKKAGKQV